MEYNFFNNNKKDNEQLLDQIMIEHKKREEKYDIKKSYLLKSNKKEVSVFKQTSNKIDDKQITDGVSEPNNSLNDKGAPVFIIDQKHRNTVYKSSNSKNSFNFKKIGVFVLIFVMLLCVATGISVGIVFLEKHDLTLICGNFDGITIKNENDQELDNIKLRLNETLKFKVELNLGYEKTSNLKVYFNDELLEPDDNGFYSIKNINNKLKLQISGIRPNEYDVTLSADSGVYLRDKNNQVITNKSFNFIHNDTFSFRVVNGVGDNFVRNTYAVYYDNVLQNIDSNYFCNINIVKKAKIVVLYNSPYEYFEFKSEPQNNASNYEIVGLTTLGQQQERIYIPSTYREKDVKINIPKTETYENVKFVGVPRSLTELKAENFFSFVNLEKFEVYSNGSNGASVLDNGILINSSSSGNKVVAVPQNIKESKINISFTNNTDFLDGCFYNLKNVDEISINCDNANFTYKSFNMGENNKAIIYNITSLNYVNSSDKKSILKKSSNGDFSILLSVPYCTSEYVVPSGVSEIGEYAFSKTRVTNINFENVSNLKLNKNSFANLITLETLKFPVGITEISERCFYGCINLKTVDLTNLTQAIKIENSAFEACYNNINIIVNENLYDSFIAINPDIKNLFIKK